jgi:hypothetical protein
LRNKTENEVDGHVAGMGEMRNSQQFYSVSSVGRDHVGGLGVDRTILKWILDK